MFIELLIYWRVSKEVIDELLGRVFKVIGGYSGTSAGWPVVLWKAFESSLKLIHLLI